MEWIKSALGKQILTVSFFLYGLSIYLCADSMELIWLGHKDHQHYKYVF